MTVMRVDQEKDDFPQLGPLALEKCVNELPYYFTSLDSNIITIIHSLTMRTLRAHYVWKLR